MIDLARYQSKRCDLVWLSHKHQTLIVQLEREEGVSPKNQLYSKAKYGVITGTFRKPVPYRNQSLRTLGGKSYDINEDGYVLDYNEEKMRTTEGVGGVFLNLRVKYGKGGRVHLETRLSME